MNIEDSIKILDKFITEHKLFNIKHSDGLEEAIETLLTAYEKEKEKNKELSNSYDKLAKECNEENRRCMLLAVENQDLKDKIKAKIEEVKDGTFDAKIVLQSLLRKEFPVTITKEELEKRWKE